MRRADRLFDIIQRLRTATRPMTAAALAEELEVTVRTVYRDVATLQARRVPIEGAAGVGYMLRRGFDLPPLMFTAEEIEAIAVGARLVSRTGDPGLQDAAESVLSKVTAVLPEPLRAQLVSAPLYVSTSGAPVADSVDLSAVRQAIRDECKLQIEYVDEKGERTERVVWPIALAYYVQATLIGAWCELRQDYRHFRADRIRSLAVLQERYPWDNGRLMAEWLSLRQEDSASARERQRAKSPTMRSARPMPA
jgi:predicted DNA-binding transcriptional regulator YafY